MPNDVLFSKVGAGIGDCCLYPNNYKEAMLSTTGITRFRAGQIVNPRYLCYFLLSYRDNFIAMASQTAQPFLNMGMIKNVKFPIPPFNEQKRIVEKVDQLMKLCDELEESIKQANECNEKLMQSVLNQVFNGVEAKELVGV